MTRKNKLLKKFLENPGSLRYRKIEKILLWLGFKKIDGKGSHVRFVCRERGIDESIPIHGNDCKICYKRYISKLLKNSLYE